MEDKHARVYAVLGVNIWSWYVQWQWNDLTLDSEMMLELCTRKRGMGIRVENDLEDYKWIWDIRGTTCLIELGRLHIGVITCLIGTHTCLIEDGTLTCIQYSVKFQFLMMTSSIPSHLCLPCRQLYHHLRIKHYVITLYLSMPNLGDNIEYSIGQILDILSTTYTMYCIIPRWMVSRSQPVSHLSANNLVLNSLHSHNY
jgi:hypothetical protein